MRKIFISIIISSIVLILFVIIRIVLLSQEQTQPSYTTLPDGAHVDERSEVGGYAPGIARKDGTFIPVKALEESEYTKSLAEDLLTLTEDDNSYEIMYDKVSGRVTILLYQQPLSFTRALAEKMLLETLSESKEDICSMDIQVFTNTLVDARYAGSDLGLSFCTGSITLE